MEKYIILQSNIICKDKSFINNSNNFKTLLPKELNLDSEWEVALTEISIPSLSHTLSKSIMITYSTKSNFTTKLISKGFFENNDDLCSHLNDIKPDWFKGKIYWDNITQKIIITLFKNERILMSNRLKKILGFKNKHYYNHPTFNKEYIKIFSEKIIRDDYLIYIFSDIIKDTLIGNTFKPILRLINIDKKYEKNMYLKFKNLMYMPLKTDQINSIQISMRKSNYNLINFKPGIILLTLHFRTKK
jgi:hypothetical protein